MTDEQPMISFSCLHCGLKLEAPLSGAGMEVVCPAAECGKRVIIPGAAQRVAPVNVVETAETARPDIPSVEDAAVAESTSTTKADNQRRQARKKVILTKSHGKTPHRPASSAKPAAPGGKRPTPSPAHGNRKGSPSSTPNVAAIVTVGILGAVVVIAGLIYAVFRAGEDPTALGQTRNPSLTPVAQPSVVPEPTPDTAAPKRTRKEGRGLEMTQEEIDAFSKRLEKGQAERIERDRQNFENARKKAEAGDAEGQVALGTCYHVGRGTDIDLAEARNWYAKAAEQNHPKALFGLAALDKDTRPKEAAQNLFKAGMAFISNKDREWAEKTINALYSMGEITLVQQLIPGLSGDSEPKTGTGWFGPGGYVFTCHHVVSFRRKLSIENETIDRVDVEVVKLDPMNDIAILKIKDRSVDVPNLPLSSEPASLGQRVFTLGFPHIGLLGKSMKLTEGSVSATAGLNDNPRDLQISVPVQGGNSGGPLINNKGEVIGVVSSKIDALGMAEAQGDMMQNVNYAVKHDYVDALMQGLPPIDSDELEHEEAPLETLVKRVRNSIVLVRAE